MRSASVESMAREVPNFDRKTPLSLTDSVGNKRHLSKFQSALFQNGIGFELAMPAIENGANLGMEIFSKAEAQSEKRCHSG
jgi:hypothetical protein